jgi:hypothetical protein
MCDKCESKEVVRQYKKVKYCEKCLLKQRYGHGLSRPPGSFDKLLGIKLGIDAECPECKDKYRRRSAPWLFTHNTLPVYHCDGTRPKYNRTCRQCGLFFNWDIKTKTVTARETNYERDRRLKRA